MNVLMLLPDLPGHFHAAARALGEAWKTEGHRVVFAVTSAYYPSFKGVDFRAVGPVADLSADRLSVQPKDDFGHWATYSTPPSCGTSTSAARTASIGMSSTVRRPSSLS